MGFNSFTVGDAAAAPPRAAAAARTATLPTSFMPTGAASSGRSSSLPRRKAVSTSHTTMPRGPLTPLP